MVVAQIGLELDQLALQARQVGLELHDNGVGRDVVDALGTAIDHRAAAGGLHPHGTNAGELLAQLVQAGSLNVHALIGQEDAALFLGIRQGLLGGFQLAASHGCALFEEASVLTRRIGLHLHQGVKVGLGKSVGQGGRKIGLDGLVGQLEHRGFLAGLHGDALDQALGQPVIKGATATGFTLPAFASFGTFIKFEVLDHTAGHVVTLDDAHLGGQQSAGLHGACSTHAGDGIHLGLDHDAGGGCVGFGPEQAEGNGKRQDGQKHRQGQRAAGSQDAIKLFKGHGWPQEISDAQPRFMPGRRATLQIFRRKPFTSSQTDPC